MAIEQMFTELPTVSNSTMSDIICAVQGYVSPSVLGLSTQQTLQQVFSLFQSNVILSFAGSPNGNVAGTTYQFCWDSLNSTLYICVSSGTVSTAVWVRADINDGYTTMATAGATTTLTLISTYWQFFTGVLSQTVVMPVESTLSAGMTWQIVNNSSGSVTIQSSGLNTIATLSAGQVAEVTCILNSGTSAASWNANVSALGGGVTSITGTANQVIASSSTGAVTLSLPQDIATTSSPTFANVTFGSGGQIRGANGLPVMNVLSLASAVNWISMNNQITGVNPGFVAIGSDTNVGIGFVTQAAGFYTFATTASSAIQYQTGTGYQHNTNFVFPNTAATRTLTYPDADGTIALTSGASGIVNPGLINQLAYYAAAGSTISGLTTANNGVLVTSAGGVPSISTTLPSGLTIPGYAHSGANSDITSLTGLTGVIRAPTAITDSLGNLNLQFIYAASAVNFIGSFNSDTGMPLGFAAAGADADIIFRINTKGNAPFVLITAATTIPLQICNGTANQHLTQFQFSNTAATRTVTFPDADGTVAFTSSLPTPSALTKTDDTNVTLTLGGSPTVALLAATSLTLGWTGQLGLTRGGSNASLTASNGGIVYSTASAMAILAGTATANQMLLSGASGAPSWSTATHPATTTINQILYSSAANVISGLATANSGVLVTSAGGVPSISTTLPNVAHGTPTSITLTNGTGLPIAGITGLGTGVATALAANVVGSGGIALDTDTTWTPVLSFGGASVGITYTTQLGHYTRIGNVVTFTLQLLLSNKGSSTGIVAISLPVAQRAGTAFTSFSIIPGFTYTVPTIVAYGSPGAAVIGIQTYSVTGVAATLTDTNFSNTSLIIISGSYLV